MRSARSEALSLGAALALPAAVFLSFPYSAFQSVPAPAASARPPFAAFVTLTPEQEARAMQRAKSSARRDAANAAIRTSDLILRELPDDAPAPVVRISARPRPPEPARVAWRSSPYLPSQAAPPAAEIAPEKDAEPTPAFPKAALLDFDGTCPTAADRRQTTTTTIRKEDRP